MFEAQLIGSFIITAATLGVGLILMKLVNSLPYPWKLRVEPAAETNPGGLDVFEHGISAYPFDGE